MQLIRITTTPIEYELSTERARLEIVQDQVQAKMDTAPGLMEMRRKPTEVRMDSFEFRKSIGLKSVATVSKEEAERGKQAVLESMANYADVGNTLLHIEKGGNIPDTAFSQYFQRATKGDLVLVPTSPIDISWEEGSLEMNFNPAKLNIQWQPGRAKMKFVPGSVKMVIKQMPSIHFEYLGGFNYVPPSADPDYKEKTA